MKKIQLSRIKYPLEYWANDYSTNTINDKLLINYYTKNQIRFNDFKFKGKAVQNIIKKNDTVLLQIKGKDSGLLINYYFFKKSNGKWLLVKVENKSN